MSRINLFVPRIGLLRALKQSDRSSIFGDFLAGLNVALLAMPQGMAYSLVAGLPIKYGLVGSAIAAIAGGFFGGGKFITQGPTNATAVLLFGAFAGVGLIGPDGMANQSALQLLPLILLSSALMLVLASIFRVSFVVQFVSRTVITAYVSAGVRPLGSHGHEVRKCLFLVDVRREVCR